MNVPAIVVEIVEIGPTPEEKRHLAELAARVAGGMMADAQQLLSLGVLSEAGAVAGVADVSVSVALEIIRNIEGRFP
jgi:hypothetical protein